jgi:hypothetical protein
LEVIEFTDGSIDWIAKECKDSPPVARIEQMIRGEIHIRCEYHICLPRRDESQLCRPQYTIFCGGIDIYKFYLGLRCEGLENDDFLVFVVAEARICA